MNIPTRKFNVFDHRSNFRETWNTYNMSSVSKFTLMIIYIKKIIWQIMYILGSQGNFYCSNAGANRYFQEVKTLKIFYPYFKGFRVLRSF